MQKPKRASSQRDPRIDLDFRPETYFSPLNAEHYVLSHVKGMVRRKEVLSSLAQGQLDGELESMLTPDLPEPQREDLSRISPAFLGGEFLPPFKDNEVEIARITLDSVSYDVTAVFACYRNGRYHYRVVDEYEGETLVGPSRRTSVKPLSLGDLMDFIDRAWPIAEVVLSVCEGGLKEALSFFRAESAFYPQLDALCRQRVRKAYRERF